jgi:hypothetical protein
MKPAIARVALFVSARAGSATGPGTPPPAPGRGVGGPVRREAFILDRLPAFTR